MNKKVVIFVAICYSISILAAVIFHYCVGSYNSALGGVFATAYMFIPLISVVITQLICRERVFAGCGFSMKINRWWFVAGPAIIVITMLAVLLSALMPGVGLTVETEAMQAYVDTFAKAGLTLSPTVIIIFLLVAALLAGYTLNAVISIGEEGAWRGFLSYSLDEMGFFRRSLVIGAVWGFWHAPLILMGHNYPSHPVIGVFMMALLCILMAPIFLYFREKSGSMIVAAIAHGTLNATAGMALVLLSGYNELTCGMAGVAGMIVLAIADLFLFWRNSVLLK